ncbi:MAG: GGDEF domain-containing protein [Alphaproteobacteria bacterium]|nr:GGDEF domain-containing protein [Alphaproteobacteria bacterium]
MLSVAAQAEQCIAEQEARIHQLESLTSTDELTGLLNRRGFMEGMNRALQSARRYDEEGVISFIDLDGFKAINDTYGHPAGDMVLRRVAELLLRNVRKTDLVARIGGDEFAVLLIRAVKQVGRKRAEILRQILNASNLAYGDVSIPIRASIGSANYTGWSLPEEILNKADRAMYRQKHRRARNLSLISQREA